MTPQQIAIARALGRCSFPPATRQKRFARNMAALAETKPDHSLSAAQAEYLYQMAQRYRRQLPTSIVEAARRRLVEISTHVIPPDAGPSASAAANLPRAAAPPPLLALLSAVEAPDAR